MASTRAAHACITRCHWDDTPASAGTTGNNNTAVGVDADDPRERGDDTTTATGHTAGGG